jgi:O-antigen ligase
MSKFLNIHMLNIHSLILALFPLFLISGPFLPDLFCSYFALYFLYHLIKNKEYHLINNYYFYFFLIIYFYLNLNSLNSFDPSISFQTSIVFIRIILFIFFISFIVKKNPIILKYFYFIFLLGLSFLLFDSLIQFFFNINIIGQKIITSPRISSFFGDELIMGSYVSRMLPLIIGLSYIIDLKKKNLLNCILLLMSFVLVIFSNERLALFYILLFIISYFLINKKFLLTFICLSGIFLIIIVSIKPNSLDRLILHTISQSKQTNTHLSYRHVLHIKTAYEMFLDKKILGHGLKSFRYLCSNERYTSSIQNKFKKDFLAEEYKNVLKNVRNGCNTHPHSIYFQFLAEIGIVGFFLFLIFFIYLTKQLILLFYKIVIKKNVNKLIYARYFILVGLFSSMIPMLPSGNYFNNWLLIITYLPIGFYLSTFKKEND